MILRHTVLPWTILQFFTYIWFYSTWNIYTDMWNCSLYVKIWNMWGKLRNILEGFILFVSATRDILHYIYIEVGQLLTVVRHFYLIPCQVRYLTLQYDLAKSYVLRDKKKKTVSLTMFYQVTCNCDIYIYSCVRYFSSNFITLQLALYYFYNINVTVNSFYTINSSYLILSSYGRLYCETHMIY